MLPPIGSGRQTAPGKNYMIASGYPATYYEIPTAQGEKIKFFSMPARIHPLVSWSRTTCASSPRLP